MRCDLCGGVEGEWGGGSWGDANDRVGMLGSKVLTEGGLGGPLWRRY